MRKVPIGLLGLAAVAPTAPALAGPQVLSTAPAMHIYPAQQTLYCDIVNVGTKTPQVTVEIVDYFGNVTSGPLTQTLPPANGTALGESSARGGAYCRFTVVGASKKDMRAVGVYDNNSSYQMAIPAQ